MEDAALYQEIVDKIVPLAKPYKIIIFGSRARGDADRNSDVDIMVIADEEESWPMQAGRLYTALSGLPIEVDIVVYSPEDVSEWSGVPQALVTTAYREGRVVYERTS